MNKEIRPELLALLETHPCYNECAHKKFARMHLPIAPKCNIQCNFCNRKYDCTNESRPGVTSEVLTPEEAVEKIRYVRTKVPYLSVIGIAGPGDPLANEETFRTLELVGREFPDLTLCLSTNGLNLPQSVDRLKALNVRFVTVTMNAIDPEVGAKVYDFVHYEGRNYRGVEAATILLRNQQEGIRRAAEAGMLVKVNSVLIPGINADHLPAVAKRAKELGAYIINILPLIPVPGTKFENLSAPTAKQRRELQDLCEVDIRQMRHCRQCRADAIGLLGEDRSAEFARFTCAARAKGEEVNVPLELEGSTKYRIAVATSDGRTVDQHYGHAERFRVYEVEAGRIEDAGSVDVSGLQEVPLFGPDHRRKMVSTAERLRGMDAVISLKYGDPAIEELRERGIIPIEGHGDVHEALRQAADSIYKERAATFG
ncbi:MAG: molybdenum cofactor biosynthesis protein A [Methanomassiliicoccales archaeon PtaU1.Bin030]|nr:MAG: molybdenum cofactor biosynthesis protein A [Methanomassiliicoccales archaeon PtaU1.Bin030]